MKKMKRLAALFLAVVMIMAMGMTAMAAPGEDSGDDTTPATGTTITIEKALKGAGYTAYKIFEVKGSGDAVSYTRPITEKELPVTDLFTPVKGEKDVYYNVNKDDMSADALATYIKSLNPITDYALATANATATNNDGDNNTAVFENVEDGYYYIINDKTATIAILRAVSGTPVTITEKNTTSGFGDGGGKFARNAAGVTEEDLFYAIGDTIYYEIVYKNAYNYSTVVVENDDGSTTTTTEKVYKYVADDTMEPGLELDTTKFKVEVKEKDATEYRFLTKADSGVAKGTYTGTVGTDGFSIEIPWAATQSGIIVNEDESDAYYGAPTEIKITYQVKVTANVNAGEALSNDASIRPNEETKSETNTDTVDVYTGSLTIDKYDANTLPEGKTPETATDEEIAAAGRLEGATFVLKNEAGKYLTVDANNKVSGWVDAEADATPLVTGADGKITVTGLDKGTYTLKETVAPEGYNLLVNEVTVTIAEGQTEEVQINDLVNTESIANNKGTVLPSTGGIGTTIFYVVGGIMVLGAGVLLITKKRMSAK